MQNHAQNNLFGQPSPAAMLEIMPERRHRSVSHGKKCPLNLNSAILGCLDPDSSAGER